MKQSHMKQWFVAFSLIVFMTMALKIFLEPSQLDIAINASRKNVKYFTETRPTETPRQNKEKDTKSSTSKKGHSQTGKVTLSLEKPFSTSKCGYDASFYINLLTFYCYGNFK